MTELAVAVCSIAMTQRRRFFWAAWWTGAPMVLPFRKPDASNGGATSHEEALAEAEKAAGRTLSVVDPRFAKAWTRVLRGQPPWPSRSAAEGSPPELRRPTPERAERSIWQVLGVSERATLTEVKSAFRAKAKLGHPDLGGDAAAFRELKRAYDEAVSRVAKSDARPKRKR